MAGQRTWLERLLLWRVWERMLEIEFVDRSVALAGKAFVSFFPLVIVVAAFMPDERPHLDHHHPHPPARLRGDALRLTREAFASSDDVRDGDRRARARAHDLLRHLVHDGAAARLPARLAAAARHGGSGVYCAGPSACWLVLACMAVLGALRERARRRARPSALFAVVASRRRRRCGGSPPGSCCSARCGPGCCSRPALITGVAIRRSTRSRRRSGCPRW